MVESKWMIVPPLKKTEALKQGIKAGGVILTGGIMMFLLGLKLLSTVFIFAGLFFMVASPFIFRDTTIKGYCPSCNRFMRTSLKDHIACPFCKHEIDTDTVSSK
ncbi:MAG: hypothetical protein P4N41_13615 [Negativicutes bacterium]|nr:hypothetical protein [Negativicutes bacterium]